ncbi:hypothetical protein CO174_05085 [Candidatus Uhrbacteria bacterium CG_4_9_14_3_um_filter_50_9]|uniref:Uncharacterized protein n=1 Tax=Candidatus Uhrbacteria bacterium CG_4_9_14_3_um_filter_50_9 TaxID=1975035 RepID=A0A2M7XB26_9BACT|nr:MAG: hypothetical protein CO174_05085 [Candidatus Uhrbacteria bacterium CG_4_9_14_3_um_filter_50_9]
MKYIRIIAIVVILLVIAMAWQIRGRVNTSDRFHTEIYTEAEGTQAMNLTASGFREQEVNGELIGSSSYLRIEWTAPEKEYNHFLLTMTNHETGWSKKESGEHERFSLDIGDLEANTTYTLVLQACLDPTCERWYASDTELTATTPKRYWQLDGEAEYLYGLQEEAYQFVESDLLSDDTFGEADVIVEPTEVLDWNENSLILDKAVIYWIDGRSYERRMMIPLMPAPASSTEYISATLLNP